MDFNAFPAQWEWVALILGAVALVVTLPQLIWGGPKISLVFRTEDMEGNRFYICEIHNTPIMNKLLKKFGVRRDIAQDVTASFEIQEKGMTCPHKGYHL